MKKIILSAFIAIAALSSAKAQSSYPWYTPSTSTTTSTLNTLTGTNSSVRYQRGYTRTDGTYVTGHMKTNSNGTNLDNFSTSNNLNPYTGTTGTRARDYSPRANNYGAGSTIMTGPRGGQYYMNSNGNKTYVPKRR